MESADALAGLNAEQRAAAEAVRGRVCIIAGAGSGKTTTITHRIAHQVATETFRPGEILAVTFTDKAAAEMRSRLSALGVAGVAARTFHSAALAVLRALAPEPPANVLPSKIVALRPIANRLPGAYRFRPAADLAAEIERAKNLRISPDAYQASLRDRKPPIPPDLMERVYRSYEHWKLERGLLDFEDMLELAGRLLEEDEHARTRFRARFRAFTVDEYQDVNLLQQRLLELWLGDRDDLCVVGDDYQSIYGFTGATPSGTAAASSAWSRTTARRRRCWHSRTGSCRSYAARRRRCVRCAATGPIRSPARSARGARRRPSSSSASASCTRTACRSRRSLFCTGRTRARRSTRKRSRGRRFRTASVPGRFSRARRRGGSCPSFAGRSRRMWRRRFVASRSPRVGCPSRRRASGNTSSRASRTSDASSGSPRSWTTGRARWRSSWRCSSSGMPTAVTNRA